MYCSLFLLPIPIHRKVPQSVSALNNEWMIGNDVDDRAEEEEDDELEQAASHGNILRLGFPSPAAFGSLH